MRSRVHGSPPEDNHILAALMSHEPQRLRNELKPMNLHRGTVLSDVGDGHHSVFFPTSGVVSVIVVAEKRSAEVVIVGKEAFIGVPAYLGERHAATRALVQHPGSAYSLSLAALLAVTRNPEVAGILNRYLRVFIATLAQIAFCRAIHNISQQLARWLLMFHDRANAGSFSVTHDSLSRLFGVRRSTVTNAAAALQKRGAIEYGHGRIDIVNRPELESAACQCYGILRKLDGSRRRH